MTAKKDFKKHNPALDYISNPLEPLQGQRTAEEVIDEIDNQSQEAAPSGRRIYEKIQPVKRENRSTKLNLLVTPTVHAKIKEISGLKGQSMNGLIHNLLERYIREFEKEISADEY